MDFWLVLQQEMHLCSQATNRGNTLTLKIADLDVAISDRAHKSKMTMLSNS